MTTTQQIAKIIGSSECWAEKVRSKMELDWSQCTQREFVAEAKYADQQLKAQLEAGDALKS